MKKGNQVLWFLFACVVCLSYSQSTSALVRQMGWPAQAYFALTTALVIAALVLLYLPVKLLAGRFCWRPDRFFSGPKGGWIGVLIFAVLLIGYGLALWFARMTDPAFCFLFGAAVLCFAGFSLLCGMGCALPAVAVAVFVPTFLCGGINLVQSQVCFAGSILLLIHAFSYHRMRRAPGLLSWIFLLLSGVLSGIAMVWDFMLICFPLLFLGILIGTRKENETFWAQFSCYFCALFCAYTGALLIGSLSYWGHFSEGIRILFFEGLARSLDRRGKLEYTVSLRECWMMIAVYLLIFLNLFGKKKDPALDAQGWVLPFSVVSILNFMTGASPFAQGDSLIFLGGLAGYGVMQMCTARQEEEEVEEEEEEETEEPKEPKTTNGEVPSDKEKTATPVYLSNPLPVPPRHVPRTMGYAFEPKEELMRYDLDVDDKDDFDV